MASQYKPAIKSQEKTPKKPKISNSMDDEKNNSNKTHNNSNPEPNNLKSKPQKLNPKANSATLDNTNLKRDRDSNLSPISAKSLHLSASDSGSTHSLKSTKSTPTYTINRSFIKNSKLNIKMNASRPEQPAPNTNSSNKQPFDNELVLQNLIRAQIEYLFSDYHLTNDTYLLARMQDNNQHWLSIDELCHNQKIRCLTNKKERILQALRESKYLQLSSDNERVRRPDFTLPKLKPNRDLRRTVFLYGIPSHKTEQDIRKLLSLYGHIKRIHFQPMETGNNNYTQDDEAPNQCVAQLIMKKKFLFPSRYSQSDRESDDTESVSSHMSNNSHRRYDDLYAHPIRNPNGDPQDFSHLKTCFVVFESQSQATKCVKARVRAVDGMRSIHKYDYNKVAKKYRTAQMKGENLTFSPPPNNQQNMGYNNNNMGNNNQRARGGYDQGHGHGHGRDNYNKRYNRSFNNPNDNVRDRDRDRRGYQYRERSHSTSSTNSNGSGYGGRYQQRYQQRNQNNSNYKRAQTPNFKPNSHNSNSHNSNSHNSHSHGGGGNFYDSVGRKNRQSDDSDNERHNHGHRGLGRRGDRNSHDNEEHESGRTNSSGRRDNNNNNNNNNNSNNKYNSNTQSQQTNKNRSFKPNSNQGGNSGGGGGGGSGNVPAQSASPHRSVHSVGNMSTNSDQKPILYSLNSSNKSNESKTPSNNNVPTIQAQTQQAKSMTNVTVKSVQVTMEQTRSKSERKIHTQPQVAPPKPQQIQPQNPIKPPPIQKQQQKQQQPAPDSVPVSPVKKDNRSIRAATPNMNSNGSMIPPPKLHTKMYDNDMGVPDINQLKQDLKQNLSSQPGQMTRSRTQPSAKQKGARPRAHTEPTAPTLYHPMPGNAASNAASNTASNTRQQAAELAAAGYTHELYYLPNMDDFMIMDDPLIAYDSYFGLDPQTGQSASTTHAAQQLANATAATQTHANANANANTNANKHYYMQQHAQQQHAQQQHALQQQSHRYNQQYTPKSHAHQSQQQHTNTNTNKHYYTQQHYQQQQYGHHPPMQTQSPSYSTHGHNNAYTQQSSGPRSAPYGPINAHTQQQLQFQPQQWQLDKLEQYKQAKAAQIQAVQQQQQNNANKANNNKPATALSVLSSK